MTVQTLIDVAAQAAAARQAQRTYGSLDGHQRTTVLRRLAELIGSRQDAILEANAEDLRLAKAQDLALPLLRRPGAHPRQAGQPASRGRAAGRRRRSHRSGAAPHRVGRRPHADPSAESPRRPADHFREPARRRHPNRLPRPALRQRRVAQGWQRSQAFQRRFGGLPAPGFER